MDLSSNCNLSCVKLYLCSNPEDSIVERRALRESVFPKLREHCRCTLGLDVRVVDPFESCDPSRWPDENTRQQLITECRESSAGPFLLALIGHQYGTASLPAQLEVSEYQLLLQESQQVGISTRKLERVYQRDENTIPPSYGLRLLHGHTCHSQSEIEEGETIKMKAEEEELTKVFHTIVTLCVHNGCMTSERAHRYYRSVLDADLRFALGNPGDRDIAKRCLIYIHKVVNAKGERGRGEEKEEVKSHLQRLSQSETATDHLRTTPTDGQMFSELCDTFLPALITSCQLLVYTTTTECDRRHGYTTARRRSYAESLCQQVHFDLVTLINSWKVVETGDSQLCDALAREQTEQEELCDSLRRFYDISRPEEAKVRAYVEQSGTQCPLVLTGGPCTGKTVLLAHCARQIKSWLPDSKPVVITHFANLSINTSTRNLLSSWCYQIAKRYRSNSDPKQDVSFYVSTDPDDPVRVTNSRDYESNCSPAAVDSQCEPTSRDHVSVSSIVKPDISLSELKDILSSLLTLLPSTSQPLVLILDGLDQIENNFSLPVIESLPSPLPPGVKLILAVSSKRAHVLQAVKLHYPQCSPSHCVSEEREKQPGCVCVEMGSPDRSVCVKMLSSLLSRSGRKVTSGQQVLVNQALTSCCLTLYARLLHEHTSLWQSASDEAELSLPDGVHSSISALLDHLERKHGSSIVTRAVSYLSLSRTGLTEAELADLLSSDDRVLVEYVRQGESPSSSMRVPQIDLETLLLDLRRFLIRRRVAGSSVLFWVNRHLKLVVSKRYLDTHQVRTEIHSEMVDYFCGRWACGNAKPLLVNPKSETEDDAQMKVYIDRQPPSQPFVFTSSSKDVGRVNFRKVVELPYHLQLSGKWHEMEHKLLMSLNFHEAMVRGGLLGDLVAMLEHREGSSQVLLSRQKLLLASILKSSACLLQRSPLHLATVMEASLPPYLKDFPILEGYVKEIRNERRKRETGLGVVLCPAPSSVPSIQYSKCDGKTTGVSVAEAAGTECGTVALIMDDGSAWVWKSSECDVVQRSLSCEQKELKFAGVKSSGHFMLLSTHCNKLFLWDITGPQVLLEVKDQTPNRLEGFVAWQKTLFVWWKNETFVSVFDTSNEMLTHFQCQNSITCLVCSTNGFYLYCGQEDGGVSIFDIEASSLLGTCSNSNHNAVALIVLCEDKGGMACVDKMGNITLWDLAAKTQTPRLVKETFIGGKSKTISNIDYSEENNTLLVCQSHQVTLWDTSDWEMLDQFLVSRGKTFTQALLSHGCHLFLALLDTCALVLVWRVSTGECVLSLETNKQPHTLLKMASDVICVTQNGCLTLWDSEIIDAAGTAPKMRSGVREVLVEQTGEWFYTTDGSEAVWRWDLEAGLPHDNFLHDGPVEKLCLSPNGVHLVSLSAGEIYVWLTDTCQNTLRISGGRSTDILITPNNNFGVSISEQGLSRVWKLTHGNIVCSIHPHLSNAQVSPESTFLIGHHHGDLLAASLWSGSISKRFSCVESSDHVVAFHTLSEHPGFVVVIAASRTVYTWKVVEETVCRQFQLPSMFHCQPRDFQVSTDGSCVLLSTDNETIEILDVHQVRLCSFKTEGTVIKACLDKTGGYAVYMSRPASLDKSCTCSVHTRPVLTVVRLADGERVGSVLLCKTPSALVVFEQQWVFVGFEDGSVGVYHVLDGLINSEESIRGKASLNNEFRQCPFDSAPLNWLPLATPNVTWP
ncbi:NACHT and WD repeat domain-containing protein 2 isoform X1 [Anabas testudineus]|uniref:NACHT and WD repeat domain-containing protein 2 isoform X1 n=1 Tax=Anabas testudineus TaxID=64144 RepID=UPI000E455673|nr:NACHT and WD repeat domain-containing protein 2 isoform X1 [Anabas testudineus]